MTPARTSASERARIEARVVCAILIVCFAT
jgi:hypothetical protein